MSSLKQFIRNVRAAKTIADERIVVQKESAAIRTSFREESGNFNTRRKNVSKLLYLFTLGERTHFGQIECLKLLASPRFADKRLGYLGTMLLLDENQEVLTLVTNSLKNDLNHSNQYVVGLALCALGNIASVEMSRDLYPEIETIMSSSNLYIRRKAALCAMRICRKVPELQENFIEKTMPFFSDHNHGVLMCGLTLASTCIEVAEEEGDVESVVEAFRPHTGALVKTLKALSNSGYAPEHDVGGITDPFLQVKILRLLRYLGRGDSSTSEQINDILAQVATNTDSAKNVGHSILYEAVLTILDIDADSGLCVLGVNILGKFLSNRDNNIRYVALNTLVKVVNKEPNAVQRHRNTILDCLRDPDISIRRRALELVFALINESNVRVLVRELLAFLEVADNEFKPFMASRIVAAGDQFAPDKQWHIDTMLRVLSLAGNYVKEQILSSFVRLIATTPELQTYAVQKLYASLKDDITQEGLTIAGTWVIGEFGDALIRHGQHSQDEEVKKVKESDVVDFFITLLNSSYATQTVSEYIITAAMKLTTRFSNAGQIERIRRLIQSYKANINVEIQQRATEYFNLFSIDQIRRGVLEKMPPPQIREDQKILSRADTKKRNSKVGTKKKPTQEPEDMLLDLMSSSETVSSKNTAINGSGINTDLLADIMGMEPTSQPVSKPAAGLTMDMFGPGFSPGAHTTTQGVSALVDIGAMPSHFPSSNYPSHMGDLALPVYNKDELLIELNFNRTASGVQAIFKFRNVSNFEHFSDVNLQVAVPKSQKIQLQAISASEIGPGDEATMQMRVLAAAAASWNPQSKLRLRLKIRYSKGGADSVLQMVEWTET